MFILKAAVSLDYSSERTESNLKTQQEEMNVSRADRPMVISKEQLREMRVRGAGKPLTPVGGAIRPKKGGSYSRAREKDHARREDY